MNVSAGLYLWKVDHLPHADRLTAVTGILVSEAKILMQRTRALRTFEAERAPRPVRSMAPSVLPDSGGFSVLGAL